MDCYDGHRSADPKDRRGVCFEGTNISLGRREDYVT